MPTLSKRILTNSFEGSTNEEAAKDTYQMDYSSSLRSMVLTVTLSM